MMLYALSSVGSANAVAVKNVAILIVGLVFTLAVAAFGIVVLVGQAKMFGKAGQPRWAVIIPFYNGWTNAKVGGRPGWWGLLASLEAAVRLNSGSHVSSGLIAVLAAVSLVAFIFNIMVGIAVAKSFGKSTAFGVWALGIFEFVGYLSLGYGRAQYLGPGGTGAAPSSAVPGSQPPVVSQPPMVSQPPANPTAFTPLPDVVSPVSPAGPEFLDQTPPIETQPPAESPSHPVQ
ncbi:MAG TPA: DUF5684 domain-containing protein [Candidatus Saccharimonadales bacterium]